MRSTHFKVFIFSIISSPFQVHSGKRIENPKSPCPEVLKFAPNYMSALSRGQSSYADIIANKPTSNSVKLEIFVQLPGIVTELYDREPNLYNINITSTPEDMKNKYKPNLHYRFIVSPTKSKKTPWIITIQINNQTICSQPPLPNVVSTVKVMTSHILATPPAADLLQSTIYEYEY